MKQTYAVLLRHVIFHTSSGLRDLQTVPRGMLRIIKYFDMPLPGVAVQRLAFTADPGAYSKPEQWRDLRTLESRNVYWLQSFCFPISLFIGLGSRQIERIGHLTEKIIYKW